MMNRTLYFYLFIWLCVSVLTTHSLAQTITTGALSSSNVCPGGTLTVTFATSSTFAATNSFSAQLSDATGAFAASPPVIGSVTSTTARAVNATIPATTATGAGYRVRVVSSNPVIVGSTSSQALTVGTPAPGTSPISYCVGQSATALTAVALTGATLNWFGTAATGGTAATVSPTPSTTVASGTTYYVSQTLNGCESPRASLVVTVNSAPTSPTAAQAPTYCQNQPAVPLVATAASGATLNWYGTTQSGGTPSFTASTPNTSQAGQFTYYVSQSVGSCESGRTSIPVTVNVTPAAPLTATAPSYCQNQPAVPLVATAATGAILNWYGTAATGGVASTTAPTPNTSIPGITNYYVSQTLNSCEGSRAAIPVTVNTTPGSPGVVPISFCQNTTAGQLVATPSSGGTLNWYGTAATGGVISTTAPTPPTSTTGTTLYYVSQSINGCEGPRTSLAVTIIAPPAPPTATPPAPYCRENTPSSLTASGQNLKWYGTNATGGTGTNTPTVPNTTILGPTNYYVSQTVNGCESGRTPITVTVKPTPATPTTTATPSYCQNQPAVALVATASPGAILNWYGTAATGGTASTTATTPTTSQANTTSYYVSQTLDGCEGPRATIAVTVNAIPGSPGVAAISYCQNIAATPLTAVASSGGTLNWYSTAATGGVISTTAPTPPTSTTGTTSYYVSQSVNGCEGQRVGLTVTVNPLPAPPSVTAVIPYCQLAPAQNLSANASGQNLLWYDTNPSTGTGSPIATIPNTGTPGEVTYYVTQTVNRCESTRAGITVKVKPTPATPTVAGVEFCQGATPPVLTATLVTNATPNWYGTNPTSGTATATAPVLSNATAGTTLYYVSQTLDGCESGLGASAGRAALSVRVKGLPPTPGVAAISFCNNSAAPQLTASGSNLKWYDASDNPISGGAPTPGTGAVGNQTYKVSQTVEGCEGSKANLVVTIKPLPDAPGVANINYCLPTQDQPAQTSAALTASGQNLIWFNPDGNSYPNAPTPAINQLGTQTYQVSQTVNGCTSTKATLQVAVRTTATPTLAKSLVTYCINDKAVPLSATGEIGGKLKWINPYNQLSDEAPTPYTLNTSVKPDGDPFYVYQIGQNGCYSERTTIKVLVNAQPTLALVAPVTSVNLGQRANLQLKFTSAAPYSYTITGGYSGTTYQADTTISVLPRGNTTYQVVTVSNSCGVGLPGNPATATITVRVPTVTTSVFTSSTLCAGTSLTVPFTTTGDFNQGNAFGIELVSVADTSRKYATPATSAASPVTAPVPLTMASGQYYVRVKANNPEIAILGSNSPTLLTVRSQPAATLTGTQNVYEGYPANLTLTFGGESPWTVAYADSVSSYSVVATTSPYSVEVRPSRSTTYRLLGVTNGCGSGPVSGTATVSVLPLLGVVDNPLDPLVKTYPTPTTSTITIELDLPLTLNPAMLSLTDMSGRAVLQKTTRSKKQELDLTAQPSGLYLLHIQVGDRQTVRKVLKQ